MNIACPGLGSSVLARLPIQTVRIGAVSDMTGDTPSFGISSFSGIKLAVDKIKARDGVNGRSIETFLEDDQGRAGRRGTVEYAVVQSESADYLFGIDGCGGPSTKRYKLFLQKRQAETHSTRLFNVMQK